MSSLCVVFFVFFFKQKTAYEMRISDWSSDVCSSDLRPARPELRAAPEAIDLAVLKRLAGEADVIARTRGTAQVKRLWSACGLPDFQKLGIEEHARMVLRLWRHLSEGNGHIPQDRSEEHTSELQSLMRISYAVFCLKKKTHTRQRKN